MAQDDKSLLTIYLNKLMWVMAGQAVATAVMLAGFGLLAINLVFAPEKRTGWLFHGGVALFTLGPLSIVGVAAWRRLSSREARRVAKAEMPLVFQVAVLHPDQWVAPFQMAAKGCQLRVDGVVRYRRIREGTEGHKVALDLRRFFGLVRGYMQNGNAEFVGFPTCKALLLDGVTDDPRRDVLVEFSDQTKPPRVRVRVGFDMPALERLDFHRQLARSISMIPGVVRLTGADAKFP